MKTMRAIPLILTAVSACLFVPAGACAAATSPLAGRWSLDVAHVAMPPEQRPRRVTLAFDEVAGGGWSTRVEIVDAQGKATHAQGVLALDGTPAKVSGDYGADLAAARMPAPGVLVMQLASGGVPASTRIYSVAADGRTMTETKAFFGRDGQPVLQSNTFVRVP